MRTFILCGYQTQPSGIYAVWIVHALNRINGTEYADTLNGTLLHDQILGLSGNDTIKAHGGIDFVYAGNGQDWVYGGQGPDYLEGGSGDDILRGDDGQDTLRGDDGHDTLYGGDGEDKLYGATGNDQIYGNEGGDTLFTGIGVDMLDGGDGDDYLLDNELVETTLGYKYREDMLIYLDAPSMEDIGFTREVYIVNSKTSHVYLPFGVKEDNLSSERSIFYGSDTVNGKIVTKEEYEALLLDIEARKNNLDDRLLGSAGDDYITAGAGNDLLDGGAGNDILVDSETDYLHNVSISAFLDINDALSHSNFTEKYELGKDTIWGGDGNDALSGKYGSNTLDGGNGNDVITVNTYSGSTYRESRDSGLFVFNGAVSHNDYNSVTGGEGADRFLFNFDIWQNISRLNTFDYHSDIETYHDIITDFTQGLDKIQLHSEAFGEIGNDVEVTEFAFASDIGGQPSTGQARLIYDQSNGNLYYSEKGDYDIGNKDWIKNSLLATVQNNGIPAELDHTSFEVV